MIELSLTLQEHLALSTMLHSKLCPRQVLSVRMARWACVLLGVDPALNRKSIYVYMETGHCAADGVMVVTGASPNNGLMRLVGYGKLAATFVRRIRDKDGRQFQLTHLGQDVLKDRFCAHLCETFILAHSTRKPACQDSNTGF
jgi:formylmethanofuran dehydrogenase subunit E